MTKLFEQNRIYVLSDDELNVIGDREKLAQWRHKNTGPAYYRLGRKIIYRGSDLNAWAEANRVDPVIQGKVQPEESGVAKLKPNPSDPFKSVYHKSGKNSFGGDV
jgi:hypothetical protein